MALFGRVIRSSKSVSKSHRRQTYVDVTFWWSLVWVMGGALACAADGQPQRSDASERFPVFNAIRFKGRPTTVQLGLEPIHIRDWHHLWRRGENRDQPNERQARAAVRHIPAGALVCLDIEHWPVKGPDAAEGIRKLVQVLSSVRDERPDLIIGFYGLLPIRDYWRAIRGPDSPKYQQWVKENQRLEEHLAHLVDVVFPSLYTFYPDEAGWEKYAIANLQQARRYGKPVYPFIWPQYHNSNKKLDGKFLSGSYWLKQLDICRQYADGIVIWGHSKTQWDGRAAWWQETVSFLNTIKKDERLR